MEAKLQQTGQAPAGPHNLIVEDRHTVTATGITRIVRCDEEGAVLETKQGTLTVSGHQIQVSELSVQTGEMKVYGQICCLQYSEARAGGVLRRLIR